MAALEVLQNAQLRFLSPTAESEHPKPRERVKILWSTPFEFTTLEVWRRTGEDGSWNVDVLGANLTRKETSYSWMAEDVGRWHFRLQKGDMPNESEVCMVNSAVLIVDETDWRANTSSAPATGSQSGMSRLGIGVGVAVGVGVAIIILSLMGLVLWMRRRSWRRRHQTEPQVPSESRQSTYLGRFEWEEELQTYLMRD